MKKFFCILLLSLMIADLFAQTTSDAILMSDDNYTGTARSLGMGNALTAVGGDLGSVNINPAGSAVAGYSQFTVSPGLSVSYGLSSFQPYYGKKENGHSERNSASKFNVPNIGIVFNFDNNRRSGLKSYTFGLVANSSGNYLDYTLATGPNEFTSITGAFAWLAEGFSPSSLDNGINSYYDTSAPWNAILGYQSGLTGTVQDDEGNTHYIGSAEVVDEDGNVYIPGRINQTYSRTTRGRKDDVVFNFGFNISDKLYLGLNLGMPLITYSYDLGFKEKVADPALFFEEMTGDTYDYSYSASAVGFYAKFGFIWLPVGNLRIGGALQTPTGFNVTESWYAKAAMVYSDSKYDYGTDTPVGEYQYDIRTPLKVNLGAAYTFGKIGMVSVDWEMSDYGRTTYYERDNNSASGVFEALNKSNRLFAGPVHTIRIGGELRLTPEFSVRAGFNTKTSAVRYWTDQDGWFVNDYRYVNYWYKDFEFGADELVKQIVPKDRMNSYSLGFGYSSPGSFFLDAAARLSTYRKTYKPYDDYIIDAEGIGYSPIVVSERKLLDVVLTLGWRF